MTRLVCCFFAFVVFSNTLLAQVIDNFESPVLDENWVKTTVLNTGGELGGDHVFETQSIPGFLKISNPTNAGSNLGASQQVLLRDDFVLGIGQTLIAKAPSVQTVQDTVGICISVNESPSRRTEFLGVAFFNTSSIFSFYFNEEGALFGPTFGPPSDHVFVGLYISRLDPITFEVGYLEQRTPSFPVVREPTWTFSVDSGAYGNAVGFWADLRTCCGGAVPEVAFSIIRIDDPDVVFGDVDGNGLVNLLDVQPFIDLLTSGLYLLEADINQDGFVNLLDVQPFVDLLTGA